MSSYTVTIAGVPYQVTLTHRRGTTLTFSIEGESYCVAVEPALSATDQSARPRSAAPSAGAGAVAGAETRRPPIIRTAAGRGAGGAAAVAGAGAADPNEVRAPIPGIIAECRVVVGELVEAGATLVVIEAMKMENPIRAPRRGTVREVHITKGSEVAHAALLVTFVADGG